MPPTESESLRRRLGSAARFRTAIICFAALTLVATAAADATAARPLATGIYDNRYASPDPTARAALFDETVAAGADLVRIAADWRAMSVGIPADPRDPADPAYEFAGLDAAVRDATERGFGVILLVSSAPDYAEAPGRGPHAAAGTWRPHPAALGAFGAAVATRYSGAYAGLPRVPYYQVWNEPNLISYLTPQYEGKTLASPLQYRAMLNAFYDAVKSVDPSALVLTGGTAPYGDPPGIGARVGPLQFWRRVLCVADQKRLKPTPCGDRARFDIFAHHPINGFGGPTKESPLPNDSSTAELDDLIDILRAAERHATVGTPGRHPVWATELWWDSDPPDPVEGVPLARHARWLQQALYVLWRQGARVVLNFQVRDVPFDPADPFADTSTGLYFIDGTPKPALTAFRFPLVAERLTDETVRVWGRAPSSGRLVIERWARGRWRAVASMIVVADQVFQTKAELSGPQRFRAQVGAERSLVWRRGLRG